MVNIRKLKAQFALNGMTQEQVAQELGISRRTFVKRLNDPKKFTQEELESMIKTLNIDNPTPIFFDIE